MAKLFFPQNVLQFTPRHKIETFPPVDQPPPPRRFIHKAPLKRHFRRLPQGLAVVFVAVFSSARTVDYTHTLKEIDFHDSGRPFATCNMLSNAVDTKNACERCDKKHSECKGKKKKLCNLG